jgi:3-methylcrotonyl-CoA carboxylase beta subunit
MGGEQAANVLAQVKREQLEKNDRTWSAEDEAAYKAPLLEQYERQSSAYYATARLWDDGIIDPLATRSALAFGLATAACAPVEPTRFGVFRM